MLMGKTARVETYYVTVSKSDMHGNISCAKNVSQLFLIYSRVPTLPTRTARGYNMLNWCRLIIKEAHLL
jgi:hypothetical protein